jgi:hypothetical protein
MLTNGTRNVLGAVLTRANAALAHVVAERVKTGGVQTSTGALHLPAHQVKGAAPMCVGKATAMEFGAQVLKENAAGTPCILESVHHNRTNFKEQAWIYKDAILESDHVDAKQQRPIFSTKGGLIVHMSGQVGGQNSVHETHHPCMPSARTVGTMDAV